MPPELRELLKRHPAPWMLVTTRQSASRIIADANGINLLSPCTFIATELQGDSFMEVFVQLVNAAAKEQA